MSRCRFDETDTYNDYRDRRTLRKDLSHKKIAGICAGIAQYLDISRFCVRTAAVISLFIVPQFALFAYGIAYFVLDDSYRSGRRIYDA